MSFTKKIHQGRKNVDPTPTPNPDDENDDIENDDSTNPSGNVWDKKPGRGI